MPRWKLARKASKEPSLPPPPLSQRRPKTSSSARSLLQQGQALALCLPARGGAGSPFEEFFSPPPFDFSPGVVIAPMGQHANGSIRSQSQASLASRSNSSWSHHTRSGSTVSTQPSTNFSHAEVYKALPIPPDYSSPHPDLMDKEVLESAMDPAGARMVHPGARKESLNDAGKRPFRPSHLPRSSSVPLLPRARLDLDLVRNNAQIVDLMDTGSAEYDTTPISAPPPFQSARPWVNSPSGSSSRASSSRASPQKRRPPPIYIAPAHHFRQRSVPLQSEIERALQDPNAPVIANSLRAEAKRRSSPLSTRSSGSDKQASSSPVYVQAKITPPKLETTFLPPPMARTPSASSRHSTGSLTSAESSRLATIEVVSRVRPAPARRASSQGIITLQDADVLEMERKASIEEVCEEPPTTASTINVQSSIGHSPYTFPADADAHRFSGLSSRLERGGLRLSISSVDMRNLPIVPPIQDQEELLRRAQSGSGRHAASLPPLPTVEPSPPEPDTAGEITSSLAESPSEITSTDASAVASSFTSLASRPVSNVVAHDGFLTPSPSFAFPWTTLPIPEAQRLLTPETFQDLWVQGLRELNDQDKRVVVRNVETLRSEINIANRTLGEVRGLLTTVLQHRNSLLLAVGQDRRQAQALVAAVAKCDELSRTQDALQVHISKMERIMSAHCLAASQITITKLNSSLARSENVAQGLKTDVEFAEAQKSEAVERLQAVEAKLAGFADEHGDVLVEPVVSLPEDVPDDASFVSSKYPASIKSIKFRLSDLRLKSRVLAPFATSKSTVARHPHHGQGSISIPFGGGTVRKPSFIRLSSPVPDLPVTVDGSLEAPRMGGVLHQRTRSDSLASQRTMKIRHELPQVREVPELLSNESVESLVSSNGSGVLPRDSPLVPATPRRRTRSASAPWKNDLALHPSNPTPSRHTFYEEPDTASIRARSRAPSGNLNSIKISDIDTAVLAELLDEPFRSFTIARR